MLLSIYRLLPIGLQQCSRPYHLFQYRIGAGYFVPSSSASSFLFSYLSSFTSEVHVQTITHSGKKTRAQSYPTSVDRSGPRLKRSGSELELTLHSVLELLQLKPRAFPVIDHPA